MKLLEAVADRKCVLFAQLEAGLLRPPGSVSDPPVASPTVPTLVHAFKKKVDIFIMIISPLLFSKLNQNAYSKASHLCVLLFWCPRRCRI